MSRKHRRGAAAAHGLAPARGAASRRLAAIDGLRGFALCLMIVYHFAFDLAWFRVIRADFNNDLFWLGFRAVVVTLFLALVGVSLVLAREARQSLHAFWRRVALIAFCAILVSVASYVTFPRTFITFGILHCIAVSSVLARPLVDFPRVALLAGIAIVALGNLMHVPLFDAPWLNWIGMMTHKPATEDYVPLFPWLGVVLIGVAAGHVVLGNARQRILTLGPRIPRSLAWMGRHSLVIYLVHQPVLVGILRVVL